MGIYIHCHYIGLIKKISFLTDLRYELIFSGMNVHMVNGYAELIDPVWEVCQAVFYSCWIVTLDGGLTIKTRYNIKTDCSKQLIIVLLFIVHTVSNNQINAIHGNKISALNYRKYYKLL